MIKVIFRRKNTIFFLDIKLSFITYKQKNNHQSLVEANYYSLLLMTDETICANYHSPPYNIKTQTYRFGFATFLF